jgi:ABC-type glycerol-3-phosphate transport system substrate-binding protein
MKGFQVGVLIFFGVFVFLGVLIFSGAIKVGGGNSDQVASVDNSITIWGIVPKKNLTAAIDFLNNKNSNVVIRYVEKDARTYESELLEAFAFGGLPDMFLVSQDLIFTYEDKIVNIPYTYFPEATFDETYIRAVDIFKTETGILGFPIFSDPLVMYYNQDILETAGYTSVPKYWSDMFEYVPALTKKNDALEISVSGVALGEFTNVRHAKEIFMALMLQLNNPAIVRDTVKDKYDAVLSKASTVSGQPAVQSLQFYSEFSDPLKSVYSWNKSRADSLDAFIAGDLAIYFGLASEFKNIAQKNPNLNFSVAGLPQVKELSNTITYADVYALAIPKTSPKAQVALGVSASLANGPDTNAIVGSSGFAPVRRDIVATPNLSKFTKVFYTSALNARSWIDPNTLKTNTIFMDMLENVSSGLDTPQNAVDRANNELRTLLLK